MFSVAVLSCDGLRGGGAVSRVGEQGVSEVLSDCLLLTRAQ